MHPPPAPLLIAFLRDEPGAGDVLSDWLEENGRQKPGKGETAGQRLGIVLSLAPNRIGWLLATDFAEHVLQAGLPGGAEGGAAGDERMIEAIRQRRRWLLGQATERQVIRAGESAFEIVQRTIEGPLKRAMLNAARLALPGMIPAAGGTHLARIFATSARRILRISAGQRGFENPFPNESAIRPGEESPEGSRGEIPAEFPTPPAGRNHPEAELAWQIDRTLDLLSLSLESLDRPTGLALLDLADGKSEAIGKINAARNELGLAPVEPPRYRDERIVMLLQLMPRGAAARAACDLAIDHFSRPEFDRFRTWPAMQEIGAAVTAHRRWLGGAISTEEAAAFRAALPQPSPTEIDRTVASLRSLAEAVLSGNFSEATAIISSSWNSVSDPLYAFEIAGARLRELLAITEE